WPWCHLDGGPGGGARASHSRRGRRRVRSGCRTDALLWMGSSQRAPGDSGRVRHCRTLLVARGGSGGNDTREALAAPPTTVLDRPASRPVGSLAIGGVGGSQAILVCLGGASGSRRATSYADTGRAGPPTRVDGLTAGARRLGPARDQRSTTSPLVKVPAPAARPSN